MLETLEKLDSKFERVFKKHVKITEITAFSLQLTSNEAVVMTNKSLYLLKKGLFGVKVFQFELADIKELKIENDMFYIITDDSKTVLKNIETRKLSLLKTALNKF
jgi:uncharacterized protein YdcH (DUF465 family)